MYLYLYLYLYIGPNIDLATSTAYGPDCPRMRPWSSATQPARPCGTQMVPCGQPMWAPHGFCRVAPSGTQLGQPRWDQDGSQLPCGFHMGPMWGMCRLLCGVGVGPIWAGPDDDDVGYI